jgi:hypothetical protein
MLYKLKVLLVCCSVLTGGCAMTESKKITSIPSVEGAADSDIFTDRQLIDEAIIAAEKYWNAQKTSDVVLFRSVTPHESMRVVFDWWYVNKTDIVVESAPISGIKYHIREFMLHHNTYNSLPQYTDASLAELEIATAYADSIEKGGYPMLGNLLKKAYWEIILPHNFADLSSYKLMNFQYTADVKLQSIGGVVLQKRVTLRLYRMQADSYDSGWKVLFRSS